MVDSLGDLDGRGPLWQQIRRALAHRISTGGWPPGTKIPKEVDIIARYGAARMTVHRALRSLAAEGLVERKRKYGTVVTSRPPERPVLEIWDIGAEVARMGAAYRFEILERRLLAADDPLRGLVGAPHGPVLWVKSLHHADGEPLQAEERLINLEAAPQATRETFGEHAPGAFLLRHVPWTEAEHTIVAQEAPPDIARVLRIAPGAACLVVERRTWFERTIITFARLWHPGGRRRLTARFQPLRA